MHEYFFGGGWGRCVLTYRTSFRKRHMVSRSISYKSVLIAFARNFHTVPDCESTGAESPCMSFPCGPSVPSPRYTRVLHLEWVHDFPGPLGVSFSTARPHHFESGSSVPPFFSLNCSIR